MKNFYIILMVVCFLTGCLVQNDEASQHIDGENSSRPESRIDFLINQINNPESKHVMVAAHRGDWFYAPENSLQGFQNCIDIGVDILEIDVRLTKDGIPVIIHDLTLDRTTTGSGNVSDWSLDSLKQLFLYDNHGLLTEEKIPTLEEVMTLAQGKILVYLDKSVDKVPSIIPTLEKTKTVSQTIFVLDFPYSKAKEIFGDYLQQVIYMPVVDNEIENLNDYIKEHLLKTNPKGFQFRIDKKNTPAHLAMAKVKESKSKLFVAATWSHHTMGYDDQKSRLDPDSGWGWLIDNGFSILETDRPYRLVNYLQKRNRRE